MNSSLKNYAKKNYSSTKSDTYSMFIERFVNAVKNSGSCSFVTPYTWMFLSSHRALRSLLYSGRSIRSLVKPSYTSFFESAIVPLVTFTVTNQIEALRGKYTGLGYLGRGDEQAGRFFSAMAGSDEYPVYEVSYEELQQIPGSPIAYWLSTAAINSYSIGKPFKKVCYGQPGLQTSNNEKFVRLWTEVTFDGIGIGLAGSQAAQASGQKWFPYLKGGGYRKWYGNQDHVVNWKNNGEEIKAYVDGKYSYLKGNIDYVVKDRGYYFKKLISYSKITSGDFSARAGEQGFVFDVAGSSVFPAKEDYSLVAGFLCSKVANMFVRAQNPTLNIQSGDIDNLPILVRELRSQSSVINDVFKELVDSSKADWDAYERSWDFQSLPLLTASSEPTPTLESSYTAWITQNRDTIAEMKRLEEENNRLFIDAYGLADELTPDVPIEQITLTANPAYRYGGKLSEEELWARFRQDSMEELVSYAIGCMMGRYSLDAPGLIYAHSGNEGFDPSRYSTFPADDDGIVPFTDSEWFEDDAANRLIEFVSVAWDKSHLEDNLNFLADNLSPKKSEANRETLRRYLCDGFFKDHMQTYKKRPIYWLFNSGKEKAFQCLVYLHRYNEGTLARMRTEYVIPLTSKLTAHVKKLEHDVEGSTSTSDAKGLEKQIARLHKQQVELSTFDEKLRHYADKQIQLDLDDGVKVNYGKFGDLLAEVKAITGKSAQ
jgi:type II restriction/modification system DNA methylase subunit YeeA